MHIKNNYKQQNTARRIYITADFLRLQHNVQRFEKLTPILIK